MADQNRPESPATAQAVIASLPETVEKLRQARALLGDAFGDLVRAEPRRPDGLAVLPVPAGHQEAGSAVHDLRQKVDQLLFPTAERDWYTEARVRDHRRSRCGQRRRGNPQLPCAGEELQMFQSGRAGRLVERDAWWTSSDIDGAMIVPAEKVEVLEVLAYLSANH